MSLKWAQNEVDLVVKYEMAEEQKCAEIEGRPVDESGINYAEGCYMSALRAYEMLCKDGHSGASFGFTRNILIKLLYEIPLTPILGTEDEWYESYGKETNLRRSSLFRCKNEDGTYRYFDVDRVTCVEDMGDHKSYSHSSLVSRMINELEPITMPYCPKKEHILVNIKTFDSINAEIGSYDTIGVLDYTNPGEKDSHDINRYFKEVGNKMVEIGYDEYSERYRSYTEALNKAKPKPAIKELKGNAP